MNKLPAKQIYLIMIIVLGIVTLSIYSTYAIFTLESESSDIVSIHTPDNLQISLESYEYQQVEVPANSYITTDVDIYNNLNYDICYSIWYKIANQNIDAMKVKVYQTNNETLNTSSTLSTISNRRINLLITNDNDYPAQINIGLISAEDKETCELNITDDKSLITNMINESKNLSDYIINSTQEKNNEAGYLTYKDITKKIELSNGQQLYASKEYTYQNEVFTLTNPEVIEINKINEYNGYYICLNDNTCNNLYNIIETNSEENKYYITKYNLLSGYLSGSVGLRKVNNNYYFYGDNPNNFIYFNCANEQDNKTCELWRIIGFVYDQETNKYLTKIIKNDNLINDKYDDNFQQWDQSNIFKCFKQTSEIKENYLSTINFKQENITDLAIKTNEILTYGNSIKTSITLMNLSDYLNASVCTNYAITDYNETCLKNNWLNQNASINEWTTSIKYEEPYEDETTNELITPNNDTVYSVGNMIEDTIISAKLNIRPVVYLKQRILLIGGDGSLDNPYIIR